MQILQIMQKKTAMQNKREARQQSRAVTAPTHHKHDCLKIPEHSKHAE